MTHLFDSAKYVRNSSGAWLCLHIKNPFAARRFVGEMQEDKLYDAEIKLHRAGRSNQANNYAWLLMGKLAPLAGCSVDEVYRQYIKDVGNNFAIKTVPVEDVKFYGEAWETRGKGWVWDDLDGDDLYGDNQFHQVIFYKGSSTFDTQQMCAFIDLIVFDCKEYGIETATPEELARYKENWRPHEKQTNKGA